LTEKRGKNYTAEVFRHGLYEWARQYAEGKLSKEILKAIENTKLMADIKYIVEEERAQGKKFDLSRINVRGDEQRAFPSKAANFLKHANRDPEAHLAVDELKNENVLINACAAYTELMGRRTPEIMAFVAFWAVTNDADDANVGDRRFRGLLLKLRSVEEPARHRLCAKFIQDASKKSARIHSTP
jgi:hypothetical protein